MNLIVKRFVSITVSMLLIVSFIPVMAFDSANAATKAHLEKKNITLAVGRTFVQKLYVKGKRIDGKIIKWTSNNISVAKIYKTGKIKAKKLGKAPMRAKYKGKTFKFNVFVKKKKCSMAEKANVSIFISSMHYDSEDIEELYDDWKYLDDYDLNSWRIDDMIDKSKSVLKYARAARRITKKRQALKCLSYFGNDSTVDDELSSIIDNCKEVISCEDVDFTANVLSKFMSSAYLLYLETDSLYDETRNY